MTNIAEIEKQIKLYSALGWMMMPVRGKAAYIKEWQLKGTKEPFPLPKGENLAILTGKTSGIVVLDVDPRNRGDESLKALEVLYGELDTVKAITGGGGVHYYFKYPEGRTIGNKTNFKPGLDIKSNSGYVVAPPSVTDGYYQWVDGCGPDEKPLADIPSWLIGMLETQVQKNDPIKSRKTTKNVEQDQPELQANAISEGQRNDTLFRLASSLRDKGLSEEAILASLRVENQNRCNPPLEDHELENIAHSAGRYIPRELSEVKWFKLTEQGNAELLAYALNGKARFCFEYGRWLIYDGKRWRLDNKDEMYSLAVEVIRQEPKRYEGMDTYQTILDYYRKCESKSKLQNMLFLARNLLAIQQNQLDSDKNLINCQNGVINLKSCELLPHDPKYYMTKICNASYEPDKKLPLWQETVDQILPDKAVQGFVKRYAGYTLTGETSEEMFIVAVGSGGNGKGVLIETLGYALGDYATTIAIDILLSSNKYTTGNEPTPEVAKLAGSRMVLASESGKGRNLDEARIKAITGGDQITARKLHCEPFSFFPDFKLWMSTNYPPRVRGDDDGIWRRLRIVTFDQSFSGSKRKTGLKNQLRKPIHLNSILTWAVEGVQAWRAIGLAEPDSVVKATEKFRQECDVVAQFLEECCEKDNSLKVKTSDLYRSYKLWSLENSYKPNGKKSFNQLLEGKGFYTYKSNGFYYWLGLDLIVRDLG